MNGEIVSRYLGGDIQGIKSLKPSKQAMEHASFYLSLFKQFKLLQQG